MSLFYTLILSAPLLSWSPCDAPFADARYLPPDVSFYLHIAHGRELRQSLDRFEIGDVVGVRVRETALSEAWTQLAAVSRTDEAKLFDQILGDGLTLAVRENDEGGFEWAALAAISVDDWTALHKRMRPKLVHSAEGVACHLLPEHSLLFFYHLDSSRLLIGPDPDAGPSLFSPLLHQMIVHEGKSLDRTSDMREASRLGPGDAGVFARHKLPLGGWSAAVVSLEAPMLIVKHASHFTDSPFGSSSRRVTFDRRVVEQIGSPGALVVAQGFRIPTDQLATFVRAQMPPGSLTDRLLAGLGDRMLVVVEQQKNGTPPAIAWAIEMQEEGIDIEDVDRLMSGLTFVARKLDRQVEDSDSPAACVTKFENRVHSIEMPPAIVRIYAPALQPKHPITLSWREVRTSDGRWCVFANRVEALHRVADRLEAGGQDRLESLEVTGQWGQFEGRVVANALQELSGRLAASVLENANAEPTPASAAAALLETLGAISGASESCQWTFETPGVNRVASTWNLLLRPISTGNDGGPHPLQTAGNN